MSNNATNKEGSHTHTYSNSDGFTQLDIPIFARLYEFYSLLSQSLVSFPKIRRHTLGQKIDTLTLDIFELLFGVSYSENKITTLKKISIKLDLLKVLVRLAKDTQSLTNNQYLALQSLLQEIGKMLGGWIKATTQNKS